MPDIFEKILYNLLSLTEMSPNDYLKSVIFAEFLLRLQKEPHSSNTVMKEILISYLRVECAKIFHNNPLDIDSE